MNKRRRVVVNGIAKATAAIANAANANAANANAAACAARRKNVLPLGLKQRNT